MPTFIFLDFHYLHCMGLGFLNYYSDIVCFQTFYANIFVPKVFFFNYATICLFWNGHFQYFQYLVGRGLYLD